MGSMTRSSMVFVVKLTYSRRSVYPACTPPGVNEYVARTLCACRISSMVFTFYLPVGCESVHMVCQSTRCSRRCVVVRRYQLSACAVYPRFCCTNNGARHTPGPGEEER